MILVVARLRHPVLKSGTKEFPILLSCISKCKNLPREELYNHFAFVRICIYGHSHSICCSLNFIEINMLKPEKE